MCNHHCHPLDTRLGRVLLPDQPQEKETSVSAHFGNRTCRVSAMLCAQQQHSGPSAGTVLFPSDGCLLEFPFDFVLEQGAPQLCPALSRSGCSAQSLPCVVWVHCRALGLLTFLSATLVLHISTHFPPPSGKNSLLFTGWESTTSQDHTEIRGNLCRPQRPL